MVINLDPTGRILGSSGFRPQKQLCWYQDRRGPKRKKKKEKRKEKEKDLRIKYLTEYILILKVHSSNSD